MNYLYGDSTDSPLKSNFLEFLRDALDFSVYALQAHDAIRLEKAGLDALEVDFARELARLERFVGGISQAIESGEKGAPDSPASGCAARLSASLASAHSATVEDVKRRLRDAKMVVDAKNAASFAATKEALARLLAPHEIHEARTRMKIELAGLAYEARFEARAPFGLDWSFQLAFPEPSVWSAPLRVESLVPHLEIRTPQVAGWISKEVKVKPQKLDKHVVTELVDDGARLAFRLRQEVGLDVGFDVEVHLESSALVMTRIGPAGDPAVGKFEVLADDLPALRTLAEKLKAASALKRTGLRTATFVGVELATLDAFVDLVHRLVEMMAPIVREISQRSLTPNELVIRRALGSDRREELFVPKATLREKYAGIPAQLAAVFAPLALDDASKLRGASRPQMSVVPRDELPPMRAQIAPSEPPPPPRIEIPLSVPPPPPAAVNPLAISTTFLEPPPIGNYSSPPAEFTPPEPTPEEAEPEEAPAKPHRSSLEPNEVAISQPAVSVTPSAPIAAAVSERPSEAPALQSERPSEAPNGSGEAPRSLVRNEALVSAMKKIALLSRQGQWDEAYQEYATVYSSPWFGDARPEYQRQALKLMVLPKAPPPSVTEAVVTAHRAAAPRLEELIAQAKLPLPGDYEMLGVTYLVIRDTQAAQTAFRMALELERERNPGSDLVTSLSARLGVL